MLRRLTTKAHGDNARMLHFQRPLGFGFGCLLTCLGVLAHGPMFLMGRHTQGQVVGMPMTLDMGIGMALIPLGLTPPWLGLLARRGVETRGVGLEAIQQSLRG